MKKLALITLTCLCFSSLSATCSEFSCEKEELKDYIYSRIDDAYNISESIENSFPKDYITSKIWNAEMGKITALNDVLFFIDFGYGPCTSD